MTLVLSSVWCRQSLGKGFCLSLCRWCLIISARHIGRQGMSRLGRKDVRDEKKCRQDQGRNERTAPAMVCGREFNVWHGDGRANLSSSEDFQERYRTLLDAWLAASKSEALCL